MINKEKLKREKIGRKTGREICIEKRVGRGNEIEMIRRMHKEMDNYSNIITHRH